MDLVDEKKDVTMFTKEQAKKIGDKLKVDWNKVSLDEFTRGCEVEKEHGPKYPDTNITNDDPIMTAKIALVHLKELPDYYTRLKKMEDAGKNSSVQESIIDKFLKDV